MRKDRASAPARPSQCSETRRTPRSGPSGPLTVEIVDGKLCLVTIMARKRKTICSRELSEPIAKPVLKWAGGKQWLAPAARLLMPPDFDGRYWEPFLGGGAFFFALSPKRATLSDKNEELIQAYCALRDDPEAVVTLLRRHRYKYGFYYRTRRRVPRSPQGVAARMIYLNRTCWNGLYRVNRQGQFNTPFGRLVNPTICDSDRLDAAARKLRTAQVRVGDFAEIVGKAEPGDWVYLDPPYITGHRNNGFLKYNAQLFTWADQKRLAQCAKGLVEKGVHVIVTNADHGRVVSLYAGFRYYRVTRASLVGVGSSRGTVTEALLSSYPILGYESAKD
jgi:DNA adenine methylase